MIGIRNETTSGTFEAIETRKHRREMASLVNRLVAPARRVLRPLRGLTRSGRIRADIERFGTWTYPFDLGNGVTTPLHTDWMAESHATRSRITFSRLDEIYGGRWDQIRCLDVACNEGYFGVEVCRRGAKEVVAFDARDVNIEKAEFIKQHFGYERLSFHRADVGDLTPDLFGVFDLTLCLGLLYHLENPMDAIRRIRAVTTDVCMIDTQVLRGSSPATTAWITEDRLIETESVIGIIEEPDAVWNPAASVTGLSLVMNYSALLLMLKHAGFREVERVEPFEGCFQPYATFDRVVLIARV